MPLKMNKRVILAACLVSLTGCNPKAKVEEMKAYLLDRRDAAPVEVTVLGTSAEEAPSSVCYVGTVEASDKASVGIRASGTLTSVNVRQGQRVSAGQLLATVESRGLRSAWESARASLDQAEDGWERIGKVYGTGTVTEAKYIEVRTKVEQARSSEAAARKALEDCNVRAPFSGIVNEVFLSVGVSVNPGDQLLQMVAVGAPEIHFPLPENEFRSLKVGDRARVTIQAVDRSFDAVLTSKGAVASRLAHSYDCVLSIRGNISGIMPGMVCKIYFENDSPDSIVIPSSAVKTDMDGRYVWVVNDSIVSRKYVTISGYSGQGIVVSDGLDPDDQVIVEGSRKVSTGMKVKVRY